ncbi:MAG: diguanylate cyclase [Janthinobacterium lividum]
MEQQAILALGMLTMTGCGGGLVFIHSSNRLLKGLNWMGAALLAGAAAAGFLLFIGHRVPLQPLADLCILLAFALCYRAFQYLLGHEVKPSALSFAILAIQGCVTPLYWLHLIGRNLSMVVLSVLLAVQLEATIRLLRRDSPGRKRLPARITAGMMRVLTVANLCRGVMAGLGVMNSPQRIYFGDTVAYGLFIAAGTGLSFCFFWWATARLTEELEHMASTDPLTRVYNRRVFLKWCEREMSRIGTSAVPFSILLMDFDHFKKINDNFGHHVGDDVLCAAVEKIQDSIRGIDVLCRWGGEEFAVLLPNASAEATLIVAERICQNIRLVSSVNRFSKSLKDEFLVTVSIGAATYSRGSDGYEAMLQRADAALYEAKNAGRNCVVLARPHLDNIEPPIEASPAMDRPLVLETTF